MYKTYLYIYYIYIYNCIYILHMCAYACMDGCTGLYWYVWMYVWMQYTPRKSLLLVFGFSLKPMARVMF